jgi:DNA processing protein
MTASPTAIALVAVMKLKGVGRRAALKIIDREIKAPNARDEFMSLGLRARLPVDELADAWSRSEDELERCVLAGVKALAIYDDDYPERLRDTPDPPAVLYVKGDPRGLHMAYCVAVVGTREPTLFGEKVARRSAATAAEEGFAIISGLAHGCDTFGHEGCLDAQGVGVAVMAHGLDKVYPAANRGLAERLLESGGCLVSEYPLGMTPLRTAFAERDRIQSGLSDGVLVVETDVKGGTMHTVRFSREQRRALACIEHPLNLRHEEKTQGNQKLLADRWAEAIPDGDALKRFLGRIRSERDKSALKDGGGSPGAQISMGF